MKKILLLATILCVPFTQGSLARGIFDIPVSYEIADLEGMEMGPCDELKDPTALITQLDSMNLTDAHAHLSHSGYSVSELKKAFQMAHYLDCPMAVANIAHHLGFMDMYQGSNHLSQLMKMAIQPSASGKSLDLNLLKRDLIRSYKTNLPKNASPKTASVITNKIVSYMEHVLNDNKLDTYTQTWKHNYKDQYQEYTISVAIQPKSPSKEQFALYSSQNIKNHADLLPKWDIS